VVGWGRKIVGGVVFDVRHDSDEAFDSAAVIEG